MPVFVVIQVLMGRVSIERFTALWTNRSGADQKDLNENVLTANSCTGSELSKHGMRTDMANEN